MNEIKIKNRKIGSNHPTYIIAEMSANHAGDIEKAIDIIHEAKKAGADCIKVQTYTADTITMDSDSEYFQIKEGLWKGETLYSIYKKAFTPWEWQSQLKKEAEKIDIDFFSTPFDFSAVDFLESIDIEFYKIASFEIVDIPLIQYIASKNKPIIMSTGLASLGEIEEAVNAIRSVGNNQICLLRCSSSYPALPQDMNLKIIPHLRKTFNVPVGLSDHSMGSLAAIGAVALGANVIEKHFCLSRNIKTADSQFSMEPQEFKKMVDDIRQLERALGKIDYSVSEHERTYLKGRKSIFLTENIQNGELFTEKNIRIIRPGNGLKPKYYKQIINKRARKDFKKGTPLSWNMLD